MILENGYEIPEGMESMTCMNNCGFIIIWPVGGHEGVGEEMDKHIVTCPTQPNHRTFRTKGE